MVAEIEQRLRDALVLISSSNPSNTDYGTGFLVGRTNDCTFIVTCAHVINRVGGSQAILVGDAKAELITQGKLLLDDIAIIKIKEFWEGKKPLDLAQNYPKTAELKFISAGYVEDRKDEETEESRKIIMPLRGTARGTIAATRGSKNMPRGWILHLDEKDSSNQIQNGHSGSPIIAESTSTVIGVITDTRYSGKLGFAISVDALLALIGKSGVEIIIGDLSHVPDGLLQDSRGSPSSSQWLEILKLALQEDAPPGKEWVKRLRDRIDSDIQFLTRPQDIGDKKESNWINSEKARIGRFEHMTKRYKDTMNNLVIGLAHYGEPIETINKFIPFWLATVESFDSDDLPQVVHAYHSMEQLATNAEELRELIRAHFPSRELRNSKEEQESFFRRLPRVSELARLAQSKFGEIETTPSYSGYKREAKSALEQLKPELNQVTNWLQKELSMG